jgi:NAD(P)-dependent dehydrogenase (short-subunit alcohol dehydrogenase family)
MAELTGKVAIVTGGASGIGRACVEAFVREGAKVVIGDVDDATGAALAEKLGEAALYLHADVSKAEEIQALVDAAVARFGGLDIMFNNAGVSSARHTDFLDDPLTDFDFVVGINLFGVMAGTQRAARHMARHGGGVILNNSSIASLVAGQALYTYRSTKAAVTHFSKSVAIELAQHNIRVIALAPGHIRTPIAKFHASDDASMGAKVEAALKPVWDANKPLKRQGVPEDVANAAVFLCSDKAAQITGIVLPIDGGISTGDPVNHLAEILETQARVLAGADA